MHGRLKVKTSEEQEEAKRIERLKKQKLYQGATAKIFAKRAAGEYDVEALHLTGSVLSKNPDVYSLWNYRKEIYQHLHKSMANEELSVLYKEELSFLEQCLANNPKSYGSWEHRCFVMLHTPEPDWDRELGLCNQFLTYDERNFHCWDYRRFVIKQSHVKPEDELKFTFEKISNNFSNYSSWHYRSKLLPQIHPADTTHSSGLEQSSLLEEMELVQNAFFTDPNDQSAWFYHRWLLGRVENPLELLSVDRVGQNRTTLTFSSPVRITESTCDDLSAETTECNWTASSGDAYSCVWCSSTASHVTRVTVEHKNKCHQFKVDNISIEQTRSMETYFRHELTAATSDLLTSELESCEQLFELEPENKWVLLTIVLLMKSLDVKKYRQAIMSNFQKLTEVDHYRKNYYLDLRSRFIWEEAVTSLSTLEVNLSHQHLTRAYHTHLVYDITSLDLSHNDITSLYGINYLQKLSSLNISNNRISCCKGLMNMPSLSHINLENNLIASLEVIEKVKETCVALKEVLLMGNPCSK